MNKFNSEEFFKLFHNFIESVILDLVPPGTEKESKILFFQLYDFYFSFRKEVIELADWEFFTPEVFEELYHKSILLLIEKKKLEKIDNRLLNINYSDSEIKKASENLIKIQGCLITLSKSIDSFLYHAKEGYYDGLAWKKYGKIKDLLSEIRKIENEHL